MAINTFSVGRDIAIDIVGPGGPVVFSLITTFDAKPMYDHIKIKGLDGVSRHQELPDGWELSIGLERQDDSVKSFFVDLEAQYFNGQSIQPAAITETITNPDGSLSQYRYEQVVFKFDDAGSWAGNQSVKQKISASASRCKKVL